MANLEDDPEKKRGKKTEELKFKTALPADYVTYVDFGSRFVSPAYM
jgi:hypothetical protein